MYKAGDFVLYGGIGVCTIKDIIECTTENQWMFEKGIRYYVLNPLYQTCTIFCPVGNSKVFMRPVIKREEAERLIDMIPFIQAEAYHNRLIRQLSEHYEASINTHNCMDWIKLTMSIYEKKRLLEKEKKKLGAVDEKYLKRAEDLLHGEMSVALGISKDRIPEYIAARVQAILEKHDKRPIFKQKQNPTPISLEVGLS